MSLGRMDQVGRRPVLPAGTVTFLFTDIDGSTRLLRELGPGYRSVLEQHRLLLRDAVAASGGVEVDIEGDGMFFVFAEAGGAVTAALAGQRALAAHAWPSGTEVLVRMGLHTGEAVPSGGSYASLAVHQASRICRAAHGGQVLLSAATRAATPPRAAAPRAAAPRAAAPRAAAPRAAAPRAAAPRAAAAATSPPAADNPAAFAELGSFRLKDFDEPCRLFQASDPRAPGPGRPPQAPRAGHNLPAALSTFLGRNRELAELSTLLATRRLVTLVGPGGSGKTRLACQAASDVKPYPRDGVWLVRLAATSDPTLVAQEVAATLGIRVRPGRVALDVLTESCCERQMLLVVDNCEQVLEESATVCAKLLDACPDLQVLATSREPLGIGGERVYPVGPFEVPPTGTATAAEVGGFDAVRLFAERAEDHHPGFELHARNADAVGSICRRLDGMPLAIELAAARLRSLNVEDIDRRLDDRFALLTGGARAGGTPHHETLLAAIGWSYDLLSGTEREALAGLAVFAGSFDVAAAETICAGNHTGTTTVDHLRALVDKSLLQPIRTGPDGLVRYSMLETVRQYGADRLRESGRHPEMASAHAHYYASVVEAAALQARGTGEAGAVARIDAEFDNIRAAFTWCRTTADWDCAVRLLAALVDDLVLRERFEIGRWATELLADPRIGTHPVRPVALAIAANMALTEGRIDDAAALGLESLAAGQQPVSAESPWLARSVVALATAAGVAPGAPEEHFEAMAAMSSAGGDPMALAVALFDRALVCSLRNRAAEGVAPAEELLALGRRSRNPSVMAMGLLSVGRALVEQQPARSRAVLHEAVRQSESVRSTLLSHQARRALASLGTGDDPTTQAWAALGSLAGELTGSNDPSQQLQTLLASVPRLVEVGMAATAVTVCGLLAGSPLGATPAFRAAKKAAEAAQTEDDYWEAWERGASMSRAQLVDHLVGEIGRAVGG